MTLNLLCKRVEQHKLAFKEQERLLLSFNKHLNDLSLFI
jgi:hypothetical protein